MAVDPYSMCPCGSGKKIKFCCGDLLHDIEKIQTMIEGDQPRAALKHATQTLAKHPRRASLLDFKAMLEMQLEEWEDAAKTIETFQEVDGKNPAVYAHEAVLVAKQRGGRAAVVPLQKALSLITADMPRRVLEAIGAVGHTLLIEGNIIGARAHLWLYQGIAGNQDTRALQMLMRLNQMAGLPLMLRDQLYMHDAPENHPAAVDHDRAQIFASQGKWQDAAEAFAALAGMYTDIPSLHYNYGLVYGWLGNIEKFCEGMRKYSAGDVPFEDAVEAAALAQLLDPELKDTPIDVVRLAYPITDEEELVSRLASDKRIAPYNIDPAELAAEDGLPPRAAYLVLDRPLPESGVDINRDTVPQVIGFLSHYGRQTDRAERIEFVLDKGDDFDAHMKLFDEVVTGTVGEQESETRVGESNAAEQALSWRWHFPPDTPPALRRQLLDDQRREAITEDWPDTPRTALGGKTPKEVAGDDEMTIPLAAAVMLLEQAANNQQRYADTFSKLRDELKLPQYGPLKATEVDSEQLPLGRVPRLELDELSDELLVALYRRSMMAGATSAVMHTASAIVERDSLEGIADRDEAYRRLISLEDDTVKALELLGQAREKAEAAGRSSAEWDLMELEIQILEGSPEESNRLMRHIQAEHMEEQGVPERLFQIFTALGITPEMMSKGAASAAQPGIPQPGAADGGSGIWTPDSDKPAGETQKLWTPS